MNVVKMYTFKRFSQAAKIVVPIKHSTHMLSIVIINQAIIRSIVINGY